MYYIYTDGSCNNHDTENVRSMWSFVVTDDKDNIHEVCTGKVKGKQDCNRAELTAILKALKSTDKKESYIIRTDYENVFLFCSGLNRPKKNLDLYRQIQNILLYRNNITVEKIQGHKSYCSTAHSFNGVADRVARKSMEFFKLEEIIV